MALMPKSGRKASKGKKWPPSAPLDQLLQPQGQARAGARRSQRADGKRQGDGRHAHRPHPADHPRDRRQGRQGDPALHFGRPKNGPDEANCLKPVGQVSAPSRSRPVGFCVADCIGDVAEKRRRRDEGRRRCCSRTPASTRARKERSRHCGGWSGEAWRRLMSTTPSRLRIARTPRPKACALEAAGLCRPYDAGGTRGARRCALGNPEEARRSHRRRRWFRPSSTCSAIREEGGHTSSSAAAWRTRFAARGVKVGKSLRTRPRRHRARDRGKAKAAGCEIVLPVDGLFAKEFHAHATTIDDVAHIHDDEMMLDVGPKSVAHVEAKLATAKTLVWNGPFGAFEIAPLRHRHRRGRAQGRRADARQVRSCRSPAAAIRWPR